jgi:aspartate/methionine/tyrosine aminotransferase
MVTLPLTSLIRPEAAEVRQSGIVEVFNYGRGREGLIPLWVGEGDLPTPRFICEAAEQSLAAGETFYTAQRGHPDLRAAISAYMNRHYGERMSFSPEQFFVTCGGMHALQIAIRLVAGVGDEVILPVPAWPNFEAALTIAGARTIVAPLELRETETGLRWWLDAQRVEQFITARSKALVINTPANPTGWTASLEELRALLALARKHGLWIVADEIYGRIYFEGQRAPSFHDIMEPGDRILFVQTLSKNWSMTGWRVGWLEAPPELGDVIENLIQYSSSGVLMASQRAAACALTQGEDFLHGQLQRWGESRDILCKGLAATGRATFAVPPATFYLFCAFKDVSDARATALKLVDEANVGLAPGTAFGEEGASFMRICFARDPASISEAVRRLQNWLA